MCKSTVKNVLNKKNKINKTILNLLIFSDAQKVIMPEKLVQLIKNRTLLTRFEQFTYLRYINSV